MNHFKSTLLVRPVAAGLWVSLLFGARFAAAQNTSYVHATSWLTAAQPGPVTQGHPRYLFLEQEVAGGDPFTNRYYQSVELSADLRNGRMSGEATILNPFQIGTRRTELKAHFQPRYRVERAPGNNTSTVIPVEWRVRLKKYAVNFSQIASGTADFASTDARLLLSVQSPSAGGILAQAIYHHQSQGSGEMVPSFDVTKTVQTAGAFQEKEGYTVDLVSGTLTDYFKIATANNGNSVARIDHKPQVDSENGFAEVNLTVRHNALPGNGVTFFIWLEMTTVATAYGGGTALNWDDFEISYSLPDDYRIVAVDGQDLSHLDAGNSAPKPPATVHPITSWQWQPEPKRMTLSFPGLHEQALEVQETEDLMRWNTIRRIESSSASDLLEIDLPAGDDGLRIRAEKRFYRVVVPSE